MNRLLRHLIPTDWLKASKFFNHVHSCEVLDSIICRERDRADRTGQGLSIAVFEVGEGFSYSSSARNLVPILIHRIRSTDSLGWLKDGRLGAVLPHTPPESAWKFIEKVRATYDGTIPPPDCTVYIYPCPGVGPGDRAKRIDELDSKILPGNPVWKRSVDVAGSLAALVLLSPLILAVALLIKAVSPGPVFFRQERVGHLGRKFTLWKFRTMHVDADTGVHEGHLKDLIRNEKEMTKLDQGEDRRIIPFGGLMRATGIDELPQLVNVLMGEMSLVGPRPCLEYEMREFHPWQLRRFDTIPGLTGLWQVSGKNRTTFKQMIRLDIDYAKQRGFLIDMSIFMKTIPAIAGQVRCRPVDAPARANNGSFALRAGAEFLTFFLLNKPRK